MNPGEFERIVADLLGEVGYRVYGERLIGHKHVDIYAEYDILGRTQRVAVECKEYATRLSLQNVSDILANFRPLYDSSAIDQVILVTEKGITAQAAVALAQQRVLLHVTRVDLERHAGSARAQAISPPSAPLWGRSVSQTENDYCFVLMPFADVLDIPAIYLNHVKPVLENRCGLRCERAVDLYDIAPVMQSIWEGINRASVVVAELTGKNPNVFYELGIAHTLGKPVVMLTQTMDDVPFDLRHMRCIQYGYKPNTIRALEEALEKTVRLVLRRPAP